MTPDDFITDESNSCICGHPWPCKLDVDSPRDCAHERVVAGRLDTEGHLLDGAECHACGKQWDTVAAMEAEVES